MNQKDFLDVIRSAIFNKNMKLEREADEYVKLFSSHSLVQYLYPVFKEKVFEKYYYGAIAINTFFEHEMNAILSSFNEINVKGILIKGYYTKDLYPNSTLRVMGDVDLLVLEDDFKKAMEVLLNQGFTINSRGGHHIGFQKDKMEVELHHLLMAKQTINCEFFFDYSKHIERIKDNTYKLEDTYHLLYMVSHYAKHMINGGSGIRSVVDMYLMLQKGSINREYLNEKLIDLGYIDFFDTILSIIYYIFDYKFQDFKYNDNTSEIIDFIINCGTHGFSETNDLDLTALSVSKKGKIRYLLGKIFLSYDTMKQIYPWTKGYILLPFGYVVRFFSLLFAKRKRKKIKRILKVNSEERDSVIELFNKMGL